MPAYELFLIIKNLPRVSKPDKFKSIKFFLLARAGSIDKKRC